MTKHRMLSVGEKRCPRCAEIIRLEARICAHCGYEPTLEESRAAEVGNAKRKRLIAILAAVTIVPVALLVHECTREPTAYETATKKKAVEENSKDQARLLARATAGAAVKERMKNPGSFDLVEADANVARTDDGQPCWLVAVTYRGTNGFGGIVTEHALVWVDVTGNTPIKVVVAD